MVDNWEIEWNSSMMEHGRDLGTMEFIFAKGGNLSDMNYVMFDIQDNSWEPLIKAVAERDNSHPDIIRKNVEQPPFFMEQGQRSAQPFLGTGVTSPRQATKQFNTAQRMANLEEYAQAGPNATAGQAFRAGKYGTAAGKGLAAAGRGIMRGARGARDYMRDTAGPAMASAGRKMGEMGGRALQAVKDSGMGQRMKNFMSGAGRAISDLRHAPAAAKQSFKQMGAASEDEARRSALEGGLGRGQQELETAEGRYVPGSQGFDANMDRARASISQGLARDFRITPRVHTKGKNKGKPMESVEDAMRREIQEIGARRAEPKEGFFAGMRRRGDERREAARAQREGDAFAPSNIVPEEPVMPEAPTPEAEAAARSDAKPSTTAPPIEFGPETTAPPDTGVVDPIPTTGDLFVDDEGEVVNPAQMETATATEPTAGQRFAGEAGMKLGATAGDRVASGLDKILEQHGKTPFADREAAMQAMLQGGVGTEGMTTAGKFGGKTAKAVEAALTQMFGPAKAKAIVQAAEQGNPEAKEIVEEVAESGGKKAPMIEFGNMTMSEDTHEASWDSLLKGLDIR